MNWRGERDMGEMKQYFYAGADAGMKEIKPQHAQKWTFKVKQEVNKRGHKK